MLESPIEGASGHLASLQTRYDNIVSSIASYEAKVAEQTAQLERINRSKANKKDRSMAMHGVGRQTVMPKRKKVSADNIQTEETELKDLKERKRTLEDRISGMERDLGGLSR